MWALPSESPASVPVKKSKGPASSVASPRGMRPPKLLGAPAASSVGRKTDALLLLVFTCSKTGLKSVQPPAGSPLVLWLADTGLSAWLAFNFHVCICQWFWVTLVPTRGKINKQTNKYMKSLAGHFLYLFFESCDGSIMCFIQKFWMLRIVGCFLFFGDLPPSSKINTWKLNLTCECLALLG